MYYYFSSLWKVVRTQNLQFTRESLSLRAKSYCFKDQRQNLSMVMGPRVEAGAARTCLGVFQ